MSQFRKQGSGDSMFESGPDLPPPAHFASAPYSPSGRGRPMEVAGHPFNESHPPQAFSPARFPPPPSPCFRGSEDQNVGVFEGQSVTHYVYEPPAPEPLAPSCDHWTERNVASAPVHRMNNSSESVSHWSLRGFNQENNSACVSAKAEPYDPSISASSQYLPCDSSKKSLASEPSPSDQNPDAAGRSPIPAIPSISSASVSSPHFSCFTTSNQPFDFSRTSSRFSFNPNASAFYPGMDLQSTSGSRREVRSEYSQLTPGYISRIASLNFLANSYEGVDSFHDASSRPMFSPETAPQSMKSTPPLFLSGPHVSSGSSPLSAHTIVSTQSPLYNSDPLGKICSSDGLRTGVRESTGEYPPFSAIQIERPLFQVSAPLFNSNNTTSTSPLARRLSSPTIHEDQKMEQVLSESGTLLHDKSMKLEWGWNQDDFWYAQGMVDRGDGGSSYSYSQTLDRAGLNTGDEALGDRNSLFAWDIIEESRLQNHAGPSLKLAASALADMLSLNSSGITSSLDQSVTAHTPPLSELVPVSDSVSQVNGALGEGFRMPQRQGKLAVDSRSSSGSVKTEANQASMLFKKEGQSGSNNRRRSLTNPQTSTMAIENEIGYANPVEDVSVSMGVSSTTSCVVDQFENLTNAGPTMARWLLPRVSEADATNCLSPEHQKTVNNPVRNAEPTGFLGSTGVEAVERRKLGSVSSESLNPLSIQFLAVSTSRESGNSENPTTGAFHARSCISGHDVSSTQVETQVLRRATSNDHSRSRPLMAVFSHPSSQAHTDSLHRSAKAGDVGARLLDISNLSGPTTVSAGYTGSVQNSGLQSLAASISNLSKVLLALNSSVLPQSDSVVLQESLQRAILRLSECLLLEHSRLHQELDAFDGSRSTNELGGRKCVATDESLEVSNLTCRAGASGTIDRPSVKSLGEDPAEEVRPDATAEEVSCLFGTATNSCLDNSNNSTALGANNSQRTAVVMENIADRTKSSFVNCPVIAVDAGLRSSTEPPDSSQRHGSGLNDTVEFLRQRGMLDIAKLEKLVATEAREEELKVIIQNLRDELELEKVESQGTAVLCEKVMQETDLLSFTDHGGTRQGTHQESSSFNRGKEVFVGDLANSSSKADVYPATLVKSATSSLRCATSSDYIDYNAGLSSYPESLGKGILYAASERSTRGRYDEEKGKNVEKEAQRLIITSSGVSLDSDLEARLAILRGRPDGDTETGVFTATRPCKRSYPAKADIWTGRQGRSGSSLLGMRQTLLSNPSHHTAQMLTKLEVLSNMDAAWSRCYDLKDKHYSGLGTWKTEEQNDTLNENSIKAYDNRKYR